MLYILCYYKLYVINFKYLQYIYLIKTKIPVYKFYYREYIKKARGKPLKKSREWILEKKERRRRQGREVRDSSKYTGRKRSGRF